MNVLRRLGLGLSVAAALAVAAFVALLSWGGIKVVPADEAPQARTADPQPRLAPEAVPIAAPEAASLAIPVAGVTARQLESTWGDERGGGSRAHHGIDIIAPHGTPVLAAAPGVIEKLWESEAGGTTLYVRSPQRRVVYYYAHLSGYAPGVREGMRVRTGDQLGYVGDTGNAGAGNNHLHFGVSLTRPEQRWHEGTDIDPYPLLAAKAAAR